MDNNENHAIGILAQKVDTLITAFNEFRVEICVKLQSHEDRIDSLEKAKPKDDANKMVVWNKFIQVIMVLLAVLTAINVVKGW